MPLPVDLRSVLLTALLNPVVVAVAFWMGATADQWQKLPLAAFAGAVAGILLSAVAGAGLTALLPEVQGAGLAYSLAAAAVLITVGAIAAVLASRRAASVDPLIALRSD